jgi:hypothetical protein
MFLDGGNANIFHTLSDYTPHQETLGKIYYPPWQVLSNAVRVSKLRTHLAVCGGVQSMSVL